MVLENGKPLAEAIGEVVGVTLSMSYGRLVFLSLQQSICVWRSGVIYATSGEWKMPCAWLEAERWCSCNGWSLKCQYAGALWGRLCGVLCRGRKARVWWHHPLSISNETHVGDETSEPTCISINVFISSVAIALCSRVCFSESFNGWWLNSELCGWQAVGVVGAITPWNFPLAMITRKVSSWAPTLIVWLPCSQP